MKPPLWVCRLFRPCRATLAEQRALRLIALRRGIAHEDRQRARGDLERTFALLDAQDVREPAPQR